MDNKNLEKRISTNVFNIKCKNLRIQEISYFLNDIESKEDLFSIPEDYFKMVESAIKEFKEDYPHHKKEVLEYEKRLNDLHSIYSSQPELEFPEF